VSHRDRLTQGAPLLAYACACVWALAALSCATSAGAATVSALTPTLAPARLGAKAKLTLAVRFAGEGQPVPSPLKRAQVMLPAGMTLDVPSLKSCARKRLLEHGPGACPQLSRVGYGRAVTIARTGSQLIQEHVTLSVFVGPLAVQGPTLEVYGRGFTPIEQRQVFTGTVLPAEAPFGEELSLPLPPIHTLELEPDASMELLSLTIGTGLTHHGHAGAAMSVPRHCPPAGFPFAAEFAYADGTTSTAQATIQCPSTD
jgi:hypothetical protein